MKAVETSDVDDLIRYLTEWSAVQEKMIVSLVRCSMLQISFIMSTVWIFGYKNNPDFPSDNAENPGPHAL